MEIDEHVVLDISKVDPFGANSPFGKNDWTKFKNGAEMLEALQDNGMFWAEAYIQHLKKYPDHANDLMLTFGWFANAIEWTKQLQNQRQKSRIDQRVFEIAKKYGFITKECTIGDDRCVENNHPLDCDECKQVVQINFLNAIKDLFL